MRRWKAISILFFAVALGLVLYVSPKAQAEAIALQDGEYTVDYNILKAENDSVSMANDYFEKPAVIHVSNGKMEAEIRLNHSAWITEFKVPNGGVYIDTTTVSSNSATDTRVDRFPLQSLESPLVSKIHVTVPSVDYDHDYTIRFVFDSSSLTPVKTEKSAAAPNRQSESPSAQAASTAGKAANTAASGTNDSPVSRVEASAEKVNSNNNDLKSTTASEQVINPPTADTAPIAVWMAVLVISLLFLARRWFVSKAK
ncbi:heme uptake protein IsdC [Paenibacillus medicaginis]|uniref:Heme uptake protein IsdC n=1 Tax=Paenibacillus medicaginis TaxID=1470560 RepID=A0ABV5C9B0_9BACL